MRTEDVLAQIDDALDDWDVGPDAMRCNAPSVAKLWQLPYPLIVDFVVDTRRWDRAMRHFAAVMTDMAAKLIELTEAFRQAGHDEHHPEPLAIDGRAYRQRVRNRRRR